MVWLRRRRALREWRREHELRVADERVVAQMELRVNEPTHLGICLFVSAPHAPREADEDSTPSAEDHFLGAPRGVSMGITDLRSAK